MAMAQPISASSPAPTTTTAAPQPSSRAPENPFSLAPAIFTPFRTLSQSPLPTDPIARLELILSNLNKQHDAVRRNMFSLLEQRARDLVSRAKEELARLEKGGKRGEREFEVERLGEVEIRGFLKRVSGKREEGKNYEVKRGDFALWVEEISQITRHGQVMDWNGDVEMSGTTHPTQNQPPTASQIRQNLTRELRDLVDRGVYEIELYDVHAAETTKVYRDAWERNRRKSGRGGASVAAPQGILRNREEVREVRRMSTGVPVAGFTPVEREPVRLFENLEEVVRRGSK